MIDNFTLALTHGLIFLAAWRLLSRPDLDDDEAPPPAPPPAPPRAPAPVPKANWTRPGA